MNTKTLKNEDKEDLNKLGGIPCSWMEMFNMIKMSVLPN